MQQMPQRCSIWPLQPKAAAIQLECVLSKIIQRDKKERCEIPFQYILTLFLCVRVYLCAHVCLCSCLHMVASIFFVHKLQQLWWIYSVIEQSPSIVFWANSTGPFAKKYTLPMAFKKSTQKESNWPSVPGNVLMPYSVSVMHKFNSFWFSNTLLIPEGKWYYWNQSVVIVKSR